MTQTLISSDDDRRYFNQLISLQRSLISSPESELSQQFEFIETLLVAYGVMSSIYDKTKATNTDAKGRAGLIRLDGLGSKYYKALEAAIKLIEPQIIENKQNGINKIECFLSTEYDSKNITVFVRNHANENAVLYITSDAYTNSQQALDTRGQINTIKAIDVIKKMPEAAFLSMYYDGISIEQLAKAINEDLFNKLNIDSFFVELRKLYEKIHADRTFKLNYPNFINYAFNISSEKGFSGGLCNNDLLEASRYITTVLYLLSSQSVKDVNGVCTAIETAMGNALAVCSCPRNTNAFTSLQKSCDMKRWQRAWSKAIIKDLHTGSNLARLIEGTDKTRFNHFCQSFSESNGLFSDEESEVISRFITEYKNSDNDDGLSFELSWRSLYCIEWQDKLDSLFIIEKKVNSGAKKQSVKASTKEFLDKNKKEILESYQNEYDCSNDDLEEYFSDLQEVATLGDTKLTSIEPEERNKILFFFNKLRSILSRENKTLFNAWKKLAFQTNNAEYRDFREGFSKVLLAAFNYYGISNEGLKRSFKISSLEIVVKYGLEKLDFKSLQAVSFFSIMYGPLLRSLRENKSVTIIDKDKNGSAKLLWDLSALNDSDFSLPFDTQVRKGQVKYCDINFEFNLKLSGCDDNQDTSYDFTQSFKWRFNFDSVASSLSHDLIELLANGAENVSNQIDYCNWFKSSLNEISSDSYEKAEAILKIPAYEYNLAGSKGLFKELSLSDKSCLKASSSPLELPPSFISSKSLDITEVITSTLSIINNKLQYAGNQSIVKENEPLIEVKLKQFSKNYSICLKQFLLGQLSLEYVQNCCKEYNDLLRFVEDKLKSQGRVISLALLNLGIAFDKSEREYVKNSAIVCPWHLESLKATALKNERTLGLWRLFSRDNNTDARSEYQNINFSLYEQGLFGELSLDTYLEFIPSREYLAPLQLASLDRNFDSLSEIRGIDTILGISTSVDGYALFSNNVGSGLITENEVILLKEQILHSIKRLGEVRNEVSIVLYHCMLPSLPLRLFTDLLSEHFLSDDDSVQRISLYVVYANNDEGVKVANDVRYRTESALKKMAYLNPTLSSGVLRKFNITVCTDDKISSKISSKVLSFPKFDLCILFDTFKSKLQQELGNFPKDKDFYSSFDVVNDEDSLFRYLPSLSEYNQNQYTGESRSLLRHMQSESHTGFLKALSYVSNKFGNSDSIWAPNCAFPDAHKVNEIINCAHKLGSIVLSCDDFVKKSYFANIQDDEGRSKFRILQYKKSPISGKNIIYSACDNSISASLEEVVANTLYEHLKGSHDLPYFKNLAYFLYEDALALSGSIVLRAYNFHNNLFEMIGIVLSKFILDKAIEFIGSELKTIGFATKFTTYIMLDDFKSYLGLDQRSVADILAINVLYDDQSNHCILNFMFAESKFYNQSSVKALKNSIHQAFTSAASLSAHFNYEGVEEEQHKHKQNNIVRFDKSHFVSRILSLIWTDFESMKSEYSDSEKLNLIKNAIKTGRFSCMNTAISICSSLESGDFKLQDKDFILEAIPNHTLENSDINLGQLKIGTEGLNKLFDSYLKHKTSTNEVKMSECNHDTFNLIGEIDSVIDSHLVQEEKFSEYLVKVVDLFKNRNSDK